MSNSTFNLNDKNILLRRDENILLTTLSFKAKDYDGPKNNSVCI